MTDATKSSGSIWTRGPFWFGVGLSVIVIFFGWYSLTQWPVCGGVGPCISNWDQLRFRSSPNEIGDMLAGFAGALAFIWIVVTVLLQAAELREQREQFEKMADAQEAQAVLLEKQGKIFEAEQRERAQVSAKLLLEKRVEGIVWLISFGDPLSVTYSVNIGNVNSSPDEFRLENRKPDEPTRLAISRYLNSLKGRAEHNKAQEAKGWNYRRIGVVGSKHIELKDALAEIADELETLGEAEKTWLKNLDLLEMQKHLDKLFFEEVSGAQIS